MSRTAPTSLCTLAPSRWLRLTALLLVALQFVAPTWHICALGGQPGTLPACHVAGPAGHAEHTSETDADADADAREVAATGHRLSNSDSDEAVPEISREEADAIANAPWVTPVASHDSEPSCLAKLLIGMPGALVAPPVLAVSLETRRILAPEQLHSVSVAALPHQPSRGPPAVSLV